MVNKGLGFLEWHYLSMGPFLFHTTYININTKFDFKFNKYVVGRAQRRD